MTVQTPTKVVYFSYSLADPELAAEVVNCLTEYGLEIHDPNVYYDPSKGYEMAVKIRAAIKECDVLIVLATPSSIHSQWLTLELGIAYALQKPVYLISQNLTKENLPTLLQLFPSISMKGLDKLVKKISGSLSAR